MTEKIITVARALARELTDDIPLSRSREEHIRVTARANQATELLRLLESADGVSDLTTD